MRLCCCCERRIGDSPARCKCGDDYCTRCMLCEVHCQCADEPVTVAVPQEPLPDFPPPSDW